MKMLQMASQFSKKKPSKESTPVPVRSLDDWSLEVGDLVLIDGYEYGLVMKKTPKYFTFAVILYRGEQEFVHIHRIRKI